MSRLLVSILTLGSATALAAPVHIQVSIGNTVEFGAGYSVANGPLCFVIAPLHVVERAGPGDIQITDSRGRRAPAEVVKSVLDFDAALLKLTNTAKVECPDEWEDGRATAAVVNKAEFLVSKRVSSNGRLEQKRFFVSGISNEMLDLQVYDSSSSLQEGDSGSSLYAGNELVGMVVSVDTASGNVAALTQNQIHGLFGADVVPQSQTVLQLHPFLYQHREQPYATVAAIDYLTNNTPLSVIEAQLVPTTNGASGQVPVSEDVDYIITGNILTITNRRENNPNYKPSSDEKRNLGKSLMSSFSKAAGVDKDAQYQWVYNIDLEVRVQNLMDNTTARSLQSYNVKIADSGQDTTAVRNSALESAVMRAMAQTFQKYDLPRNEQRSVLGRLFGR
jgi:hypothetical protein